MGSLLQKKKAIFFWNGRGFNDSGKHYAFKKGLVSHNIYFGAVLETYTKLKYMLQT